MTLKLNINNEKISELHIKKIINQSEYFNLAADKFELFNNIISYNVDNTQYHLSSSWKLF